jgi:hypothetical protein
MSLVLFDLNDYELRLFRDGALAAESIGCALIGEDRVTFGDAALRRFRLEPRRSNNLYWQRMNLEALPVTGGGAAHHADLIYLQLGELVRESGLSAGDEVVVAVPGTTTPEQLGLLLGITNELGLNVSGLIDTAVAASAPAALAQEVLHLDVALHRGTMTGLGGHEEISRSSCEDLMELGLIHILDSWVSVIADRFVAQTRFDPLSIAETEQQLYDQVYDWLEGGERHRDLVIVIEHKGNQRRIDTPLALLADKAVQRYRALSRRPLAGRQVLLSHRAARLPGLQAFLEGAGAMVTLAASQQLVEGIQANLDRIRSEPESLRFVSTLPRMHVAPGSDGVGAANSEAAALAQLPSHLLFGADAAPIGNSLRLHRDVFGAATAMNDEFPQDRVVLIRDSAGISIQTDRLDLVQVNGAPLQEGQSLMKGDRLEIAGNRFTLIRLQPD